MRELPERPREVLDGGPGLDVGEADSADQRLGLLADDDARAVGDDPRNGVLLLQREAEEEVEFGVLQKQVVRHLVRHPVLHAPPRVAHEDDGNGPVLFARFGHGLD